MTPYAIHLPFTLQHSLYSVDKVYRNTSWMGESWSSYLTVNDSGMDCVRLSQFLNSPYPSLAPHTPSKPHLTGQRWKTERTGGGRRRREVWRGNECEARQANKQHKLECGGERKRTRGWRGVWGSKTLASVTPYAKIPKMCLSGVGAHEGVCAEMCVRTLQGISLLMNLGNINQHYYTSSLQPFIYWVILTELAQ